MTELLTNDLRFVVSRLPRDVRKIMENHGFVLAGGFIRELIAGGEVKDIDLFGTDKSILQLGLHTLETLRTAAGMRCRVHKSDNADTLFTEGRMPVQVIHRWLYQNPADIVASFDFTVCAAAVWCENGHWQSAIDNRFYPDLAARRLTYTHPMRSEDAGGSLLRVIKFVRRGYVIQMDSLAGVIARLQMGVKDTAMVTDESGMTKVITGLLREVDPLIAVDGIDPVGDEQ